MHEETKLTKSERLPQTEFQIYSYGKREAISITQRLLNRYSAAVIDFLKYPFVATCTFKLFRLGPIKFLGDVRLPSIQSAIFCKQLYGQKSLFT